MTNVRIKQLIWDAYNIEHIKKHNVERDEVEVVAKNFIAHKRVKLGRYSIFGRIGLRIITVIIKRVSTGVYYPVTARDVAKKERKLIYEKERK